jgi:hypothetical protein
MSLTSSNAPWAPKVSWCSRLQRVMQTGVPALLQKTTNVNQRLAGPGLYLP